MTLERCHKYVLLRAKAFDLEKNCPKIGAICKNDGLNHKHSAVDAKSLIGLEKNSNFQFKGCQLLFS